MAGSGWDCHRRAVRGGARTAAKGGRAAGLRSLEACKHRREWKEASRAVTLIQRLQHLHAGSMEDVVQHHPRRKRRPKEGPQLGLVRHEQAHKLGFLVSIHDHQQSIYPTIPVDLLTCRKNLRRVRMIVRIFMRSARSYSARVRNSGRYLQNF
mgnify:CR=1 FL=1